MTDITWIFILALAAVIMVFLLALIRISMRKTKVDALLNVDVRDPEKDYYDFVLLIPTTEVPKRKNLNVEVHVRNGNIEYYD